MTHLLYALLITGLLVLLAGSIAYGQQPHDTTPDRNAATTALAGATTEAGADT